MASDALWTVRELREVEPQWAAVIYKRVGNFYLELGQGAKVIELYE
jgi:tetratricopeptide (TPR) repeat protein